MKSEPVYNVLEESKNEETHYDVVEGIIPKDAPVYDVLEGPGEERYGDSFSTGEAIPMSELRSEESSLSTALWGRDTLWDEF